MKHQFFFNSRFAIVIAVIALFFYSCKKDDDPIVTPPSPKITSVTAPGGITSGPKNTVITIKGSNFITDLSKIQVTVNGKTCQLISASPDSILAKIPPYCGTGAVVLIMDGQSFTGPTFTYVYTYTLSSLTDGVVGYADGPLSTAKFEEFVGLTIDANDNIYTAQYTKPRVRKISADSIASTIAGDGTTGHTNANGTAAKLGMFDFCTVDASGNIFVAEQNAGTSYIRKIDVNKNVTDFYTFSNGISPDGIKVMPSGNIYFHAFDRIGKLTSGGTLSWLAISATGTGDVDGPVGTAQFSLYGGIEVSSDETKIYVNDWSHGAGSGNKVKMLTNNTITTIAGKTGLSTGDGDALNAGFKLITCTLLDKNGGLYIADGFNAVIKYLKDGKVSTFLGSGNGDVDGDISVGKINYPHGMVWDSKGNMFISSSGNDKIKKLTID